MKATEMWRYLTRTREWGYSNSFWTHVVFYITGAKARGEARGGINNAHTENLSTCDGKLADGENRSGDRSHIRSLSRAGDKSLPTYRLTAFGRTRAKSKTPELAFADLSSGVQRFSRETFIVGEKLGYSDNRSTEPSHGFDRSFHVAKKAESRSGVGERHTQNALFGNADGELATGTNASENAGQSKDAVGAEGVLAYGYCWYMPEFNEETGVLKLIQVQTAELINGRVVVT